MTDAVGFLSRLEAIRQAAAEDATANDRTARLSPRLHGHLVQAGLYKLWVPRSLGGAELDLPASLEVFEAAARIDGALGWAVAIGTGGGLFAATMTAEAANEIFRPANALIAGSGTPSGVAERIDGGFRVTGRWRYASGAHHATFFTAACRLQDRDTPLSDRGGTPLVRAFSFPAADVTVYDTWDTLGMRGTGSHDFAVDRVFVPEGRLFDVFGAPSAAGPLYRYPFAAIAQLSFARVAVGVAAHGVQAFVDLAREKPAYGDGEPMASRADVQARIVEASGLVAGARALVGDAAERSWRLAVAGEPVSEELQDGVAVAAGQAARDTVRALDLLFEVAGMTPLFMVSEFGRTWRDLRTVTQHAMLSPLNRPRLGSRLVNSLRLG